MSRRVDKEEAAHLQYETEHTEPPKSRSVVIYMAILIAAAFLLLLLAYIMQQRTASTVEGLHQSVNSFQTIDQLVEDNRALQEEVAQLRNENAQLTNDLYETRQKLYDSNGDKDVLNKSFRTATEKAQALSALNELRTLYNSGRYKEAIALIEDFPYDFDWESTLAHIVESDLSKEERDIYDPLASYQRIAKLLGY